MAVPVLSVCCICPALTVALVLERLDVDVSVPILAWLSGLGLGSGAGEVARCAAVAMGGRPSERASDWEAVPAKRCCARCSSRSLSLRISSSRSRMRASITFCSSKRSASRDSRVRRPTNCRGTQHARRSPCSTAHVALGVSAAALQCTSGRCSAEGAPNRVPSANWHCPWAYLCAEARELTERARCYARPECLHLCTEERAQQIFKSREPVWVRVTTLGVRACQQRAAPRCPLSIARAFLTRQTSYLQVAFRAEALGTTP